MKTPIRYYGGKQRMLPYILPLIPAHTLYTESFIGGAAVFFAKAPVEVEVINDLNSELINFYRELKTNFAPLKLEVECTLHSRAQHDHAWYIYNHPEYFSNTQRAWAVWMLSKTGFGGMLGASFGVDKAHNIMTKSIAFAKENFTNDLHLRLEHTTIEHDDALKVIARYDGENTFHFVDPPYIGSGCGHYKGMFNAQNLQELLHLLTTIKGKFMLTMFPNNAIETTAQMYGWCIHRVERTISMTIKLSNCRKQEEWIVMNYKSNTNENTNKILWR